MTSTRQGEVGQKSEVRGTVYIILEFIQPIFINRIYYLKVVYTADTGYIYILH